MPSTFHSTAAGEIRSSAAATVGAAAASIGRIGRPDLKRDSPQRSGRGVRVAAERRAPRPPPPAASR